jgi:membrane-bound ClpP family serine protease
MSTFKKWVVGAGLFNIIAAFPLAMPFTVDSFYSFWNYLNHLLNLGGQDMVLPTDGNTLLWVNTCGLALFLVGCMLLYASGDLENRVGVPLLNGIVRVVFSILVVYYVIVADISRIIMVIAIIDVIIGAVFFYYYRLLVNIQKNESLL